MDEPNRPNIPLNVIYFLLPVAVEATLAPLWILEWPIVIGFSCLAVIELRLGRTRRRKSAALWLLLGCVLPFLYLVVLVLINLRQ